MVFLVFHRVLSIAANVPQSQFEQSYPSNTSACTRDAYFAAA